MKKQDTIGLLGCDTMDIENLSFSFGLQTVFDDVTIHISSSDHIGIVGVNGAGKSTFFHLLLGDLEPDYGRIFIPNHLRLAYLPQVLKDEISNMHISVFDYVSTGRPIKELESKLSKIYEESASKDEQTSKKLLKEASKIQERLDYYNPYHAEEEMLDILMGMNLFDLMDKELSNLSGGEKSKVAFARLLYSKPEIILLDEPTNHLDNESKEFVMNFLKKYHGLILIISHDLPFLNKVTNKTLFLDKMTHKMELFSGSYEVFQKRKQEKRLANERLLVKQEKEEEKLKKIIAKYIRGNEKKARIAKDRQKKLSRLEEEKVVLEKKYKEAKFQMKIKTKGDYYPLKVEHLTFGYQKDNILFEDFSLEMMRGQRYLVLGENGVGKSTFLKLLMGYLTPFSGTITFGKDVSVAYYAQEHELLDENKTIIEQFSDITKDISFLRGVLGRFLFFGDDIYKKVAILSPGERSRVALAKLALQEANFLLLDEPTNHLDPDTEEIVAKTFLEYPGTMLVVSHNPDFVSHLNIEKMIYLPNGKIIDYDENIVRAYQLLDENPDLKI